MTQLLFFVFGSIFILCAIIISYRYFPKEIRNISQHKLGGIQDNLSKSSKRSLISFFSSPSSPMKSFYFFMFFLLVFDVFFDVGTLAWYNLESFSAIPETPGDIIFYKGLLLLYIILEFIHFVRMYVYIHLLEDPFSRCYEKYIKRMHCCCKGHVSIPLRSEQFIRFVIVALVSLKLLQEFNVLENGDAFRFFVQYLFLFYAALLSWDIVIVKSTNLNWFSDTYITMNAAGCCLLLVLYFSLPFPDGKSGEFSGGIIGIVISSVSLLCVCLILSFIVGLCSNWKSIKNDVIPFFTEIFKEIFAGVCCPSYGIFMRRIKDNVYERHDDFPDSCRTKSDRCPYKRKIKVFFGRIK
jgi:hypothetical protein